MLDPAPFQGLLVDPVQGVVPVGGKAELKIMLSPNALIKFDTRIQVAIRGGKTLELRVGGAVEPPCVDIDLVINLLASAISMELMLFSCDFVTFNPVEDNEF